MKNRKNNYLEFLRNIKNKILKNKDKVLDKSKLFKEKILDSKVLENISSQNKILKNKILDSKLYKNKYFNKFASNRYACTITFMLMVSFVVLFTSHNLNLARIQEINTRCFTVYVDNINIGQVRQIETVDEIVDELKEQLEIRYNLDIALHNKITYDESHAKDYELTDEKTIYNKIKSKMNYGVVGYGIKVNGKVLGVVESEDQAIKVLDDIKSPYMKMLENDEADVIDVSYAQDVEIVQIDTDFSELSDPEDLTKFLQRGTDEEKIYVVEEGDSFWSISDECNLTVEDLVAANPGMDAALIHPGDEISLIIPKPYVGVEVKAKVVYEEKIDYDTKYEYVSYMYNDEYSVKKEGNYGKAEVEAIVVKENGIEVDKEVVKETVIAEPETRVLLQGTIVPPPKKGTGYFVNPLPTGTVTSRFGPRWGSYHYGLDICKGEGTPIKAADGGEVTFAGWYGNYGYMVEINHGGGFSTRYAHCSKLNVSVGEKVYQGKTIAYVGHTGYTVGTTGNHVHFEVRKYGTPVNPQSYIGTQYRD